MAKFLIVFFIALNVIGLGKVHSEAPLTIAPNVLDLPILSGGFIPEDCGIESQDLNVNNKLLGCVAFPRELALSQEVGFEWQYIDLLKQRDWEFSYGAANSLVMIRSDDNTNCQQELAIVGWFLGDKEEIAKYGTMQENEIDFSEIPYIVLWFIQKGQSDCGSH